MIEDDLNRAMIRSLGTFRNKAYSQAMNLMQQAGISVTGDTADKVKLELETMNSEVMASVVLEFPVSAALTQARRYYASKANVDDLTQWVLDVGLDNFRYVPGYETGALPSQDRMARRIAWGIKNYKGANRKRTDVKQWLHKPLFQLWKVYRDEVIEKYFGIISTRTAQILEDALNP